MLSSLRVLYVAYPLLTVSESSAGGAEQMLWTLELELAKRGVRTTVAASSGSQVAGELFSTGKPSSQTDDFERRTREHQEEIIALVRDRAAAGRPFHLVHDKSGSFWTRAAEIDLPVLATLHLPRHFYPAHCFDNIPEKLSFNCVSESQARSFTGLRNLLGVVPNGILLERFPPNFGPRKGLLWLGRICEEKAPHLALDIAGSAQMPITLAGQVYPFSYHQKYFESEVQARLRKSSGARFIDSPSFDRKRKLLQQARALLITSQVDETSSLVAMEAAACGTPVIAFGRGALPEVVVHGRTGFLVSGVDEAVHAFENIDQINLQECVLHAREHFSSSRMADAYAALYEAVLKQRSPATFIESGAA